MVFARAAFLIVVATAAAVGGVVAYQQLVVGVDRVDTVAVLRQQVLTSGWYLTFVLLVLYSSTRKLMYRLRARQTA